MSTTAPILAEGPGAGILNSDQPVRPGPSGFKRWVAERIQGGLPIAFGLSRALMPIPKIGSICAVTRHDDVREVFGNDKDFGVPYRDNLQVITGDPPFFLGMADTDEYRAQLAAMRRVVVPEDLAAIGNEAEDRAEDFVARSSGSVEVVDLVRTVTFEVICRYFGIPETPRSNIAVWATRLFEFQFMGTPDNLALRAEADAIAPAFRAHVDAAIAARKAALTRQTEPGAARPDDVLGRCLELQSQGVPRYTDPDLRTALMCMVVGGPPQPPMVVPQAMEQLLRRQDALAGAAAAARAGDDERLRKFVREAMRFDPLAPGLKRITGADTVVARGTRRARKIPKGTTVLAAFASAMMDPRRVPDPSRFNPDRLDHEYIHFGYGLHQCFGMAINQAMLHRMLKPLLGRKGVRRAPGADGRLRKSGLFSERLVVDFDP